MVEIVRLAFAGLALWFALRGLARLARTRLRVTGMVVLRLVLAAAALGVALWLQLAPEVVAGLVDAALQGLWAWIREGLGRLGQWLAEQVGLAVVAATPAGVRQPPRPPPRAQHTVGPPTTEANMTDNLDDDDIVTEPLDGGDADGTDSDSDADGTDSDSDAADADADGTDSDADGTDSDADGTDSDADGTDSDARDTRDG